MKTEPAIHEDTFQELLEILNESIGELITTYLEETPKLIDSLHAATAAGDTKTAKRLAHSLKSSSANLGALQLAKLANAIEQDSETNADASSDESRGTAVDALLDEFRRVHAELNRKG